MKSQKRGGPPKTGADVECQTCGKLFYKKRSRLERDKLHFCSEQCRTSAISANVIDRKFEQAAQKKRNGQTLSCIVCGQDFYRKASYIARGINKTCGSVDCLSAYGRDLYGFEPLTDVDRNTRKHNPRKFRGTYFTDKQRLEWLDDQCSMCGATDNLCLDHIVPVAAGGKSVRGNAQTLCRSCNGKKAVSSDRVLIKAANGQS